MEDDYNKINRDDWNRFVIEQGGLALRSLGAGGSFLQSFEWGEFQKSLGREVFYLRDASWQALVLKYQMPLGRNYLFCPQGPIIKNFQFSISNFQSSPNSQFSKLQDFVEKIRELAKQEKSVFARIEPTNREITKETLQEIGFIKTKDIQPAKTLILDLNLSEEELLGEMHEKTRYNIGLAQRRGVTVKMSEYNEKDFDEFWRLISLTYKRQGIRSFEKNYYRKQLTVNSKQFRNLLFISYYQDEPIAANMVNIFGQTATYLHGGSDNNFRALMAPHLLQWEQIKYAKSIGCKIYDFYGCDEAKWPGVSRFKKSFGGREVSYCGTHDFIFDKWWYGIYKVGRSILR